MTGEPATRAAQPEQRSLKSVDVLAALLGVGLFLAGVAALMLAWPVGSALMLFIAGAALLPFVRIRSPLARAAIVVAAVAVAAVTPMWKSIVVHRQVEGAYRSAVDTAQLLKAIAKDGKWSELPADFPAKLEPVFSDGYSRDLKLKDCRDASCTVVVTLTDEDYDTSIRSRSFALWTRDGGETWTCGPAATYPLAPKDLPEPCESTGAH